MVVVNRSGSHNRRKYVYLKINGYDAHLQLDTASDITLISRRTWGKIERLRIHSTHQSAHSASGGILNIAGEIHCEITVKELTEKEVILLTERPSLDLLGLDWIERLKLTDRPINSICNKVGMSKVEDPTLFRVGGYSQQMQSGYRPRIFKKGVGAILKYSCNRHDKLRKH